MNQPGPGIVRPSAPVAGPLGYVVGVEFDLGQHRFLRDHLVGGRPLLSTVMGIETIACAARALRPEAVVTAVSDVQVGPPYFVPTGGSGRVEVTLSESPLLHGRLRDPFADDPGRVHFCADVSTAAAAPSPTRVPGATPAGPAVHAEDIYGLFFHGESFRVVDSAWFDDDVFVGRLARDLPPIVEPARASAMAPLLIELCLQTAGLWELAVTDRMTIPHRIERIVRHTSADSSTQRLRAVVRPHALEGSAGDYRFDAAVLDDDATVHLTVQGYRTTEFAHPYDLHAAARIRRALGAPPRSR